MASRQQVVQTEARAQYKLLVELSLLLILATLFGSSYIWIKIAVETIPPLTIVAARVSVGAVILAIVAQRRHVSFAGSAHLWSTFLLQALLFNAVPYTLISWGEQFIGSGLAGVLNATPPVFTFLIALLWTRHEPATAGKLLGVLCGIGGVMLIVGVEALRGLGQQTIGQLAVVAAGACYALAAVNGRKLAQFSPIATAAGTMIYAALLMVPASAAVDRPWTLSPSTISLAAAGSLAVFSAIGTVIYFRLLSTLGPIGTTSNSYLRAAISVLLGAAFLGEQLSWSMGAGLVLVIASIVAINGQLPSLWLSMKGRTPMPPGRRP